MALQRQKQTKIWLSLCNTFVELYNGDIRKLFDSLENDVNKIRNFIQKQHKKEFPYLSGNKICNYWLYIISQYTDRTYKNIEDLTVAPDTHVIKATHRLGLITDEELNKSDVQLLVIDKWNELLKETKYKPIDIHTPLWLWSRNGFRNLDFTFRSILEDCEYVCEKAEHVKIKKEKIEELLSNYNFRKSKHWLASNPFGLFDLNTKDIINFLIIFGSIDYSFWGSPKWSIETNLGVLDGAFALIYALLSLRNEKGHLDFTRISYEEFCACLKGNVEIPLLEKRYHTVKEVSQIINTQMNGDFYSFIKDINDDLKLFQIIINYFPSFKDIRTYGKKKIHFYKLAQLVVSDILHTKEEKENVVVDYSHLIGCADYKIPQVLRNLNIVSYDKELSNIVDNRQEIPENSKYEVEIRATMIVAINLIKEKLNNINAIDINDFIWSLGQDKTLLTKPYHLTRTTSY